MAALKMSMLGPLQIHLGDVNLTQRFESNKVRALLVYLVARMDRPHSRETLAELLWQKTSSQSALANLRYALADLRRVIGDHAIQPPYLIVNRGSLQFNAHSEYDLDLSVFCELLKTTDIEKLKQAVEIYKGDFLDGFPSVSSNPFEEWLILTREQIKQKFIEALTLIVNHHEKRSEFQQALPFARRLVEAEPWLEESHQQLMRVLALTGQRSNALAQYELCRCILASEFAVEPSKETVRIYESIRDGGLGVPNDGASVEYYDEAMHPLVVSGRIEPDKPEAVFPVIEDALRAGRDAAERLSYEEAVAAYRHGLDILKSLPNSPAKLEYELELQTALGAALLPIRNFSSPEVVQAYQRAYEVYQRIGNRPELFHVLKALSSYYALCGDIFTGLDIGRRLMEIAEESRDDTLLIIAHNNCGVNSLFAGELEVYRIHALKLLELYNEERHQHLVSVMGYDPKVATLSHGIGLWMLGYPDQALERVHQAVDWAEKIRHPFSQCYARFFLAHVHLLRREVGSVFEDAEKLILFSNQHRNSFWFAQGLIVKGWALAHMGEVEDGLKLLLQGFSLIHSTGSSFVLRASSAWLCEVSGMAGRAGEGLATLDEYIRQSKDAGVLHTLSLQYICRGDLLLRLGNIEEAETAYRDAVEIACRQSAKCWELRARLHLARLLADRSRMDEAHLNLKEIVEWFTEGFDTPDLIEAKALLEELSR